jgi:hypothetical protein
MIWFDLYGLEDRWAVEWTQVAPNSKLTPKNDPPSRRRNLHLFRSILDLVFDYRAGVSCASLGSVMSVPLALVPMLIESFVPQLRHSFDTVFHSRLFTFDHAAGCSLQQATGSAGSRGRTSGRRLVPVEFGVHDVLGRDALCDNFQSRSRGVYPVVRVNEGADGGGE